MPRVHCFQEAYCGYDIMLSTDKHGRNPSYYATIENEELPSIGDGFNSASGLKDRIDSVLISNGLMCAATKEMF